MAILDLCEEFFGTRDVYKLFKVDKKASSKDIKKSYYQLSLKVHPDRVDEDEKTKATEKFKVLSKLYEILSDDDKRKLYDEQGIIDSDDDLDAKVTSWVELYRKLFKPLTFEEINNYEKSYKGSELEKTDIKKAYLSGKGCINHMMDEVPFLRVEDEPRLQEIVGEMIKSDEVPEYTVFTNEPAQKRNRRHKKYARESKEAQKIKEKLAEKNEEGGESMSLEQQIMKRQGNREQQFGSLMDKLMQKYGNDDSEDFQLTKSQKKRLSVHNKSNSEASLHAVKKGRVSKPKK